MKRFVESLTEDRFVLWLGVVVIVLMITSTLK